MKKTWAFLLPVLLFPCLLGTSSAEEPAAAPEAATPTVKLIDAGAEPRTALRFAAKKGDKQSVSMTMAMSMEMSLGGQAFPSVKLPAMQMLLDVEVHEVTAENDMRLSFKVSKAEAVEDPEVMPQVRAMMQTHLQTMVGMKGTSLISSRGVTKEANIEIPEGLAPESRKILEGMKGSLTQLCSPFPEEEVGKGASWEVTTTISQNGLTLTQVATHTLSARGETDGTMKVALRQKADPQVMNMPGLPPGTTIKLQEMNSTGEGEIQFDLGRLAPSKSNVTLQSNMRASMDAGGQAQTMTMRMGMEMKFEEAKDE